MIIGIDIDGTLTRYPRFFIELSTMIRQAGGKVYLITGLGKHGAKDKLERLMRP